MGMILIAPKLMGISFFGGGRFGGGICGDLYCCGVPCMERMNDEGN